MNTSPSILVALSGGVDSSVAALLLKQQGYVVTGVTFRLWKASESLAEEGIIRAQRVCDKLQIRHLVIDLRQLFEERIVKNFVDEYLQGATPNPCVNCNRQIKWMQLRQIAEQENIDWIATGHYARIGKDSSTGRYQLLKAADQSKDQSYALWRLTQQDLARTVFPLGELSKPKVKQLATEAGLIQGTLRESQDICFLPDNDYRKFLLEYAGSRIQAIGRGEIVMTDGKVVGQHAGFYNFTIGQRKGFKRGFKERLYVKSLEPAKNRVVIAPRAELAAQGMIIKEVNFVSLPESSEFAGEVKIRYGGQAVRGQGRRIDQERFVLRFETPQFAVCPGQSAVVYENERLLLGGVIESAIE
jgi:tRNA-specific 2-thiouridylase